MEGDEGDVLHGDAILDHEFRVGEVIESADPRLAVTLELGRSDGTTLIYGFSRNKAPRTCGRAARGGGERLGA